jgi:hypothetical protein
MALGSTVLMAEPGAAPVSVAVLVFKPKTQLLAEFRHACKHSLCFCLFIKI